MALDSRQKRAAVIGAGRIWYRNPHPSSVDAEQRASIGSAYPVAAFSVAATVNAVNFIAQVAPEPVDDDHGRQTTLPNGFGDGEFTFQLWVKPDDSFPFGDTTQEADKFTRWSTNDPTPVQNDVTNDEWVFGNFLLDGHNNNDFENGTCDLQFYGSGRVRWLFGDGTYHTWIQAATTSSAANIVDGQWHLITCVRSFPDGTNSDYTLFVDGIQIGTYQRDVQTNMATSFWDSWTGFLEDGWYYGAEKQSARNDISHWEDYKGNVTNLSFYDDVRTSTEISDDYDAGVSSLPPTGNNLVGFYPFDEGTGTTASDREASGGDITFYLGTTITAPEWVIGTTTLTNQIAMYRYMNF